MSESVRLDRWLNAARIFGSRSAATAAATGGKVALNGVTARPHRPVEVGAELRVTTHRGVRTLIVRDLEDRRQSPARARELYEDTTPPAPEEPARAVRRERGSGRPSKRDRRALLKLRGES